MGNFKRVCTGGMKESRNDSMSFIDVRDCAAMHVAGCENEETSGRYMCLIESWHWNDIFKLLMRLCNDLDLKLFEGDCVTATQFDRSKQDSLGLQIRTSKRLSRNQLNGY